MIEDIIVIEKKICEKEGIYSHLVPDTTFLSEEVVKWERLIESNERIYIYPRKHETISKYSLIVQLKDVESINT